MKKVFSVLATLAVVTLFAGTVYAWTPIDFPSSAPVAIAGGPGISDVQSVGVVMAPPTMIMTGNNLMSVAYLATGSQATVAWRPVAGGGRQTFSGEAGHEGIASFEDLAGNENVWVARSYQVTDNTAVDLVAHFDPRVQATAGADITGEVTTGNMFSGVVMTTNNLRGQAGSRFNMTGMPSRWSASGSASAEGHQVSAYYSGNVQILSISQIKTEVSASRRSRN